MQHLLGQAFDLIDSDGQRIAILYYKEHRVESGLRNIPVIQVINTLGK